MGSPFAPSLANLLMTQLEKQYIYNREVNQFCSNILYNKSFIYSPPPPSEQKIEQFMV